ncbi:uncharacterized protein [Notamacropus eugenii]|uniref:uncharacterized protein n=1 Tax=Notamacropus eugenii TaxID=9315 RepID=UPI003B67EA8C
MAFGFLLRTAEALWLLTFLSAMESSEFATFKCQKEVSVCKNGRAEIICSSTMVLDDIELYFRSDEDNETLLFNSTTVGEFPLQHGMHLKWNNQEVTLVIQNTQFSHRGIYRWVLSGGGSSNKFTTLHVSEPPTISKKNGSLICQAMLVKAGRRIVWSNSLTTGQTEYTSIRDATGLFNLSSSQLWNDRFYSNPPCCHVVNEKGFPELCGETCYVTTSPIIGNNSDTSETVQNNIQWPIAGIIIVVLIVALFGTYKIYQKKKLSLTRPAYKTVVQSYHLPSSVILQTL